jgi:hypothetical protein
LTLTGRTHISGWRARCRRGKWIGRDSWQRNGVAVLRYSIDLARCS